MLGYTLGYMLGYTLGYILGYMLGYMLGYITGEMLYVTNDVYNINNTHGILGILCKLYVKGWIDETRYMFVGKHITYIKYR